MIKAVIFDFDDTLARSWEQKWAHHKYTAKESYGIELTDEVLGRHWGEPFDQLVGNLYNHSDDVEKMMAENQSSKDLFPKLIMDGALEVVSTLRAQNLTLGIITSTMTDFVKKDMTQLGLDVNDFFHIQGADDSPAHKPDPRVFEEILDKLAAQDITKNEIVYVGDSVLDCQAALGAGIHFVGVTTGLDTKESLEANKAVHIIEDIKKLPNLIISL